MPFGEALPNFTNMFKSLDAGNYGQAALNYFGMGSTPEGPTQYAQVESPDLNTNRSYWQPGASSGFSTAPSDEDYGYSAYQDMEGDSYAEKPDLAQQTREMMQNTFEGRLPNVKMPDENVRSAIGATIPAQDQPVDQTPAPKRQISLQDVAGLKAQAEPEARGGIATGDRRDQLLKLAGIPTDAERSKAESDARMKQQLYSIAGKNYANPEQPGISDLERARRYQAIAGSGQRAPEVDFAKQEYQKIMAGTGGQILRAQNRDEQAQAAAEAQAAKDAEDRRRFELGNARAERADAREQALQPGKLEEQQLGIEDKRFQNKLNPLKEEDLRVGTEEKRASGLDKRSNAEIRRKADERAERQFQATERERNTADFVETQKNFDNAFNKAVDDAEKAYNDELKKNSSFTSGEAQDAVKARAEAKRQTIISNAIQSAITEAKARNLSPEATASILQKKVPELSSQQLSVLKRGMNTVGEIADLANKITSVVKPVSLNMGGGG